MPNVQWMPYSFVQLYFFECDVCAQLYMDESKKIFDHFICFWKWFLSLFVFMFSTYFCFSLFKHVLCWKTGVRVFHNSASDSPIVKPQSRVHPEALASHLWLVKIFAIEHGNLPSREMPRISFLKSFFHGKLVLNLSHPL